MQRRKFVKTVSSAALALAVRRAGAQGIRAEAVRELAVVVLPASLGKPGAEKVADAFVHWIAGYRPGAEISSGYGHPRTQVTRDNPSVNYAEQLSALGSPVTREAVEKALEAAKISQIPRRPDGRHVAADLLAYFYGSSQGEDFLYGRAIRRDDCRGLASSGQRPPALT
jgi:hypothetical protein